MDQLFNPARLALGFVVLCAIFVPLERLFPLARRDFWRRPGVGTDIVHFFISSAVRKLLVFFALVGLVYGLGFLVYPPLQRTMTALPWWLQFAIANVVFDVGAYWGHRWTHTVPWLWRLHAVHHSSEHLDWLAASRVHPLDQTFIRVCGILPVYLLGFTKETFGALVGFEALLAIFIHANVRWRFGWLEWLIATPAFHHWHHANDGPESANKNFSGLLPWVDWVFGTFYLPGRFPAKYGVDDPMPAGYVAQLAAPFRTRKSSRE
ncbi:MAG: sterol desaturase family protein [Opitutae bacterium]|nr:sterol desaturase family protein [Opitutae bacterium]